MRFRALVFLVPSLVAVMVVVVSSASAEALRNSDMPQAARTESDVVGASISHPAGWSVEREPYTLEKTYGFTLWRQESGTTEDHGGTPAVRVALAYDLEPGQIDQTVEKTIAAYPDLDVSRQTVSVARGEEGVAVGPIPGSTPSTEIYIPVNGRVYRINVYSEKPGEGLDQDDKELLSSLRFKRPSQPVSSLGLPDGNSPEELYTSPDPELAALESASREARMADTTGESGPTYSAKGSSGGSETKIAEGCWRADPDYFFQVQHGRYASSGSGDGMPTGYSRVGRPNYWDEYSHGSLGYGRCTEPYYTNDKFAVDYRLNRGDFVYSPFNCGRVTFAGRNTTHEDYGILVSIKACNGKYVSLSGHLNGLRKGLKAGDSVDRFTVIGYAGDSGGPNFPVGPVHLHQAFYRYPKYNPDGSPYGGAGLMVKYLRYFRGKGGVYTFGWDRTKTVIAKDSLISN